MSGLLWAPLKLLAVILLNSTVASNELPLTILSLSLSHCGLLPSSTQEPYRESHLEVIGEELSRETGGVWPSPSFREGEKNNKKTLSLFKKKKKKASDFSSIMPNTKTLFG